MKSQAARRTCSINLSEEWLEYLSLRGKTKDGSSAPANFTAIVNNAIAKEAKLLPTKVCITSKILGEQEVSVASLKLTEKDIQDIE